MFVINSKLTLIDTTVFKCNSVVRIRRDFLRCSIFNMCILVKCSLVAVSKRSASVYQIRTGKSHIHKIISS